MYSLIMQIFHYLASYHYHLFKSCETVIVVIDYRVFD